MSVLLITPDLGLVAEKAERVVVMYAGRSSRARPLKRSRAADAPYKRASSAAFQAKGRPRPKTAAARLPTIEGIVPEMRSLRRGAASPTAADAGRGVREEPPLQRVAPGRLSRCWRAEDVVRRLPEHAGAAPRSASSGPRRRSRSSRRTASRVLFGSGAASSDRPRGSCARSTACRCGAPRRDDGSRRRKRLRQRRSRLIVRLLEPTFGHVVFDGPGNHPALEAELGAPPSNANHLPGPYSSLNPRMNVLENRGEAIRIHKLAKTRAERARTRRGAPREGGAARRT